MSEIDANDIASVIKDIRTSAAHEEIRITQHAFEEMAEEDIKLDDLLEAFANGQVLENYPDHRRGACCLDWW